MNREETDMRMFDVQGIEITAPGKKVFDFLRVPENLPLWAHAFVSAQHQLSLAVGVMRAETDDLSPVAPPRRAPPQGNRRN
jgi:hypothetical protein